MKQRWHYPDIVPKPVVIWGAADQCRVNYFILKQLGYEVVAFIDDTEGLKSPFETIPLYKGWPGLEEVLRHFGTELSFVIAIGNPYGHVRVRFHQLLKQRGLTPLTFADPTSLLCGSSKFGEGLQVMPQAVVHNQATVGDQCILNTRCLVEHDCLLEAGVEIAPGAVLCGRVRVGRYSWIGANATIRPRINIGENSIVGAGAVVVKDVPANVVVAGVPARIIQEKAKVD